MIMKNWLKFCLGLVVLSAVWVPTRFFVLPGLLVPSQSPIIAALTSCGTVQGEQGQWGSCVVIAPGLLVTAGHCIEVQMTGVVIGEEKFEILEQWTDEVYDVGFVRIDANLPAISFGYSPRR
jgi:hypothetical protein